MRVTAATFVGCVVGYVLLVVHAHWLTLECTSALASPTGAPCTSAFYLIPLVYALPPFIAGMLSRHVFAGLVTAVSVIFFGMELPNVGRLFGTSWYGQPHALYLAMLPAMLGGVLGAYIGQKRSIGAA